VKIVVGLGNPGPQYGNTRHNLGFAVVDQVAERLGVLCDREKHHGLVGEARLDGERIVLEKPLTFMNRSGECVAPLVRMAGCPLDALLVIADDVNLPLGKLRLRGEGSAGGHNGLKSIIARLGDESFARLRLGVGDNRDGEDLADYVLSRFRPDEWSAVARTVSEAADAVLCWVREGVDRAGNQYNKQV